MKLPQSSQQLELLPAENPLIQILMHDYWPQLGPVASSGCLVMLEGQTGIGKTHAVISFLLNELQSKSNRVVYYLTNSVANVHETYQDLLKRIRKSVLIAESERKKYQDQVVYLLSQSSQQESLTESELRTLQKILLNDASVGKEIERYLSLSTLMCHKDSPEYEVLKSKHAEESGQIFRKIIRALQHRVRDVKTGSSGSSLADKAAAFVETLSHEEQNIIEKLLPGEKIRTGQARIVFLSTQKFLHGYDTLVSKTHPIRNLQNSLVFIDEIDRQRTEITKFLIEDSGLDLIASLRCLSANLNYFDLDRFLGDEELHEKLQEFKGDLTECAQRWRLNYSFDMEDEYLNQSRTRLFSDRNNLFANNIKRSLALRFDQDRQKNFIECATKIDVTNEEYNAGTLYGFVNEADRFLSRFVGLTRLAVSKALKHIENNEKNKIYDRELLIASAYHNFLSQLNIPQELADWIRKRAMDAPPHQAKSEPLSEVDNYLSRRSYHDRGFKVSVLSKQHLSHTTVQGTQYDLTITATGLLKNWVEQGAKIVGISATALNSSVIRNFDIQYLEATLGKRLITLTAEQKQSINHYYQQRRQYEKNHIKIDTIFLSYDRDYLQAALEAYTKTRVARPESLLRDMLGIAEAGKKVYLEQDVSKLLQALEGFMRLKSNRYMMVYLSRSIKGDKHAKFVDFLNHYLINLNQTSGASFQLYPSLNASAIRAGYFDKIKKQLTKTKDKIIVLTTYPTLSEGYSPIYHVSRKCERGALVWVGEGPEPSGTISADIDALFLLQPKNILPTQDVDASEWDEQNIMRALDHWKSLAEAGYIASDEAHRYITDQLSGLPYSVQLSLYHKTQDYHHNVCASIAQTIGRSSRGAFKRKQIVIYADDALVPFLATEEAQSSLMTHEYRALCMAACQRVSTPPERTELRLRNLAERATQDTLKLIQDCVFGFRGARVAHYCQVWEAVRKHVLTHPTRAHPTAEFTTLHIQSTSVHGYLFSGSLEITKDFRHAPRNYFSEVTKGCWISEENSQLPILMRNPVVKAHFQAKNYATRWESHPYMLNPAAFFNLYKGALGEEAVKAILTSVGFEVHDLPDEAFEASDFLIRIPHASSFIAVDAKHSLLPQEVDGHAQRLAKLHAIGVQRLMYIRVLADQLGTNTKETRPMTRDLTYDLKDTRLGEGPILEVIGLLQAHTGELLSESLAQMIRWVGRE